MAYRVILSPEAEEDIYEAFEWYELQQEHLGLRFYNTLQSILRKLKTTPEHYSFLYEDYRHAGLPVFPYHIIF